MIGTLDEDLIRGWKYFPAQSAQPQKKKKFSLPTPEDKFTGRGLQGFQAPNKTRKNARK